MNVGLHCVLCLSMLTFCLLLVMLSHRYSLGCSNSSLPSIIGFFVLNCVLSDSACTCSSRPCQSYTCGAGGVCIYHMNPALICPQPSNVQCAALQYNCSCDQLTGQWNYKYSAIANKTCWTDSPVCNLSNCFFMNFFNPFCFFVCLFVCLCD